MERFIHVARRSSSAGGLTRTDEDVKEGEHWACEEQQGVGVLW